MDELHIQKLLYRETEKNNILHCPNVFLYGWESDFIVVTRSQFAIEFEIKCSVADFRRDFKKMTFNMAKEMNKLSKLESVKNGQGSNYFVYVLKQEVYDFVKTEVPDWCGIIVIEDEFRVEYIREPKRIHKNKVTDQQTSQMLRSMYYRFMNKFRFKYA